MDMANVAIMAFGGLNYGHNTNKPNSLGEKQWKSN